MKKITALIITALMLVSTIAFAAKPGTSPEANSPLRALWGTWGGQCEYFYLLEVSRNIEVKSDPENIGQFAVGYGSDNSKFSPSFSVRDEAKDWMILLFIKINGLNATLADVPLDSNGQRDCKAWNTQLITS